MPDVDIAVIGNTAAQEGGLNALSDSLFREQNDGSINDMINVLVVKTENKDNPAFSKLEKIYHTEAVKNYIRDNFGGTKIQISQPLASLK